MAFTDGDCRKPVRFQTSYCTAVCDREELRQFVEKQQTGAMFVHNLNLTTCLSKPFVRLDRYPSLLKELERHIEVCRLVV